MKLTDHVETLVAPDEMSNERFQELVAADSAGTLTSSEVIELSAYFIQLGLLFYLEKKTQGSLDDLSLFDRAIAKHDQNIKDLEEDMKEGVDNG